MTIPQKPLQKPALGKHVLIELYDCDVSILNQIEKIKEILISGAKAVNATIIETSFHHFSPYGVSGVVIIAESHFTIHSWPEYAYAAIDLFSCDDKIDHKIVIDMFIKEFFAKQHQTSVIYRGCMDRINK